MASSPGVTLKRTALYETHLALGARMVEFGGWSMPVEYSGIVNEHLAVRTRAGLFDVSHMGEIEVRGPKALALLQHLTCNDVSRLKLYQAQYSGLMEANGAAVDDCVIHRLGDEHFFICVNAANADRDYEHIRRHNSYSLSEVAVENVSAKYAQLALQGPAAADILQPLTDCELPSLQYYWCRPARCCGIEGLLARTGYTGEDGFEFYFSPSEARRVWNTILEAGQTKDIVPVGLGARNTLRLEAAYPLYGHELDAETTLLEANLGWICKLDKGPFLGRDVLTRQKESGVPRKLIGFEMIERGIAREGYPVWFGGNTQGRVTSGSFAPYLKKNIGLALISAEFSQLGPEIHIEIRGKQVAARQVALPFYKRQK